MNIVAFVIEGVGGSNVMDKVKSNGGSYVEGDRNLETPSGATAGTTASGSAVA